MSARDIIVSVAVLFVIVITIFFANLLFTTNELATVGFNTAKLNSLPIAFRKFVWTALKLKSTLSFTALLVVFNPFSPASLRIDSILFMIAEILAVE